MIHLLESFGCGLCFAIGAFVGVAICAWTVKNDRNAFVKESQRISKQVEDRMATQVATMAACLDEIKKRKDA